MGSSATEIAKELLIRPRKLTVNIDETVPTDWTNNPLLTTFFVSLSVVFPDGEKFFISSLRNFLPQITDQNLRDQVAGFIGQEGSHGKVHVELNRWLAERGYPVESSVQPIKLNLSLISQYFPKKMQLAITLGIEHFTASMAAVTLGESGDVILAGCDPKIRALWLWHGIEEAEHKAVAFDVYQAVGGGYWLRVAAMLLGSFFFFGHLLWIQMASLKATGNLNLATIRRGQPIFWGKQGLFRGILPRWLSYFKPSFHPWDDDNRMELNAMSDQLVEFSFISQKGA